MSLSSRSYWIRSCCFLAFSAFCFIETNAALAADSVYLMSYFANNSSNTDIHGSDGLHLAYSLDGISYHALGGGGGYVRDTTGLCTFQSSCMRDPSVSLGPDGVYRLIYTTDWTGTKIGYSESTDLLNWTPTVGLNIMGSVANTSVTWAPEMIYDSINKNYVMYWSSNISGGDKSIYYSTTTNPADISTYSTPQVLYSPGYTTIDANIVWNNDHYVMLCKDERDGKKYIYMTNGGTSITGSYSTTGITAVTAVNSGTEGAATIKIGNVWYCFNDKYSSGGIRTRVSYDNMATWQEATEAITTVPSLARHVTVGTAGYDTVANVISASATATKEIEFVGTSLNADFATGTNWYGGATPGAGQTPVIQLGNSAVMSKSPSGTFVNLYVGQTGSGALTINGTAKVVVSGNIFLGSNALGCGTITQTGSSSVTANYYVSVGRYGTGTYRMQGGSFTVITYDFNIGDILGSNGSLIIEGGTITASQFFVGSGYSNGYSSGNAIGVVSQSGGTMAVSGSADVIIGGRNTATGSGCGVGTYNISGGVFNPGSCGVFVGGYGTGTVNQSGGTFNAKQALVIGRYSTSTGTYAISGGTLSQSSTSYRLTVGGSGAGTLTVSGSGLVDAAGGVRLSNSSTATGTLNLDGGTLQTTSITDGGGTTKLNFNGGTLKAKSSTTSFLSGLDGAYVQAGGAKFDTNGYNVTVAQSLLTGVGTGSDGGLTKSGSGTLTLTGNLAYTGATQINAGQITVAGTCTLSSVVGASGTLALGTNAVVTVGTLVADTLIIGATVSAATSSAEAVPEPATLLLLITAVAAFGIYPFRRR